MDAQNLQLPDASVDRQVDKDTLDAMNQCSEWDPPQDIRENVGKYADEVLLRSLHWPASLIYIGCESPETWWTMVIYHLSSTPFREAIIIEGEDLGFEG